MRNPSPEIGLEGEPKGTRTLRAGDKEAEEMPRDGGPGSGGAGGPGGSPEPSGQGGEFWDGLRGFWESPEGVSGTEGPEGVSGP